MLNMLAMGLTLGLGTGPCILLDIGAREPPNLKRGMGGKPGIPGPARIKGGITPPGWVVLIADG